MPRGAGQKPLDSGLYSLTGKEFLLPGKVYGANFPSRDLVLPDGFVTPLRVTPHRNLTGSPPATAGSAACRLPRRHQLRGPFGQMLMEEMAKSELSRQAEEGSQADQVTRPVSCSLAGPGRASPYPRTQPPPTPQFAELSTDKLTVAQELLISRGRREAASGQGAGSAPPTQAHSFRRPKVGKRIGRY